MIMYKGAVIHALKHDAIEVYRKCENEVPDILNLEAKVRFPAAARFFSSTQCPYQPWGPPTLLYNGYWGRFPWK
jgi:hypothetical protein